MFEAVNHRLWDITSGFTQWKVNACWPSVQWQIYDWYLRPMVSYYYIKHACEPVHVQLSPLDAMVTIVNNRQEPQRDLNLGVRVYGFDMQVRWEKRIPVDIGANVYQDVLAIPEIPDLTPIYFVRLDLDDAGGDRVSSNFYWLSRQQPADAGEVYWNAHGQEVKSTVDLSGLVGLPSVRLNVSHRTEHSGPETMVHAMLENPTDKLAFFVHLTVTRGPGGEEVLPVFWEDNYFSLLPGESRQVSAAFATDDLGEAVPVLHVGGWNIENA
jgi:exo-1,4-beta-D-glucosaminidase